MNVAPLASFDIAPVEVVPAGSSPVPENFAALLLTAAPMPVRNVTGMTQMTANAVAPETPLPEPAITDPAVPMLAAPFARSPRPVLQLPPEVVVDDEAGVQPEASATATEFEAPTELTDAPRPLDPAAPIAVAAVELLGLGSATPGEAALRLGTLIAGLLLTLTGALLFIAMIDLPVQYARHMAKLRMSKQEVRDEAKESEGSPETKAAIRRMQRLAARGAVRPAMAEATVVVVNPTSFAVALRYDPLRDAAPVVVARGRELAAAAIRELAGENGVPVLRYPQLTRALYFTAKLGQPIRDDLFTAVAAVLAFVFSLDRAAMLAAEPPEVTVPEPLRFDEFGRAAAGASYSAADR